MKEKRDANADANGVADPSFSYDSSWFFNNFKGLINAYTQTHKHLSLSPFQV